MKFEFMKYAVVLAMALVFASADAQLLRRGGQRPGMRQNQQQPAPPVRTGDATKDAPMPGDRSIEFNGAAIDLVYKVYSDLTGKTVLRDPKAPTPAITLQPKQGQELTDDEKILAIETVLEMNGIHFEPYGEKFVRAMPRNAARKEGVPLILDPDAEIGETTKVVSFMLQFKNIGVEDAQKALDNFKSNDGIIIGFERSNSLLLTDTEANISRMREIARTIDIATPVLENVFVRQIKNASAADIKTALEAIVQESQKDLTDAQKKGNVPGNRPQPAPVMPTRLLGRPNQPQQPQPVVNQSLVMGVSDADRGMIRGKVLILSDERSNKLIIVTQKSNMDFFDKVIEQLDIETTPDTVVKVYRLKYADAEDVSDMINDLIGSSISSKNNSKGSQNATSKQGGTGGNLSTGSNSVAKKPANQRTGESKAGELSKENTTVLADKRINGLVVMTDKELVSTIEQIIESMDIKLSQVLIETAIIEVTLGDDLKTGVDWIRNGRMHTNAVGENGLPIYNYRNESGNVIQNEDMGETFQTQTKDGDTIEWTRMNQAVGDTANLVKNTYWNGTDAFAGMLGGGGSAAGATILEAMVAGGTNAASVTPIGTGINYFFKSDKLNLSAVIQASKTDSRAKYIASPVVMTVDNKEATIDATKSQQFLTGWQAQSGSYSGSGMPTPNYTAKDIGVKVKVTPKINPNGTVMLKVEEEYNQVGGTQFMKTPSGSTYIETEIDVPSTRKMESDVILENMQTVVFGGLMETFTSESESGIPILKDIPWIGKWLFGSVKQTETRTELLVFMTPYVLDDSESAAAEAIRRKKSMSDVRPWDDHGWSASKLADPVSKKEQLRRLKDEWKKQDEERQTRIAIEQEKLKRVKALKEMSKEERENWLEMHKEELEEEQQEELEKKMLDPESQEDLKKLAAEIRRKKIVSAEQELKKEADSEKAAVEELKEAAKAAENDVSEKQ